MRLSVVREKNCVSESGGRKNCASECVVGEKLNESVAREIVSERVWREKN